MTTFYTQNILQHTDAVLLKGSWTVFCLLLLKTASGVRSFSTNNLRGWHHLRVLTISHLSVLQLPAKLLRLCLSDQTSIRALLCHLQKCFKVLGRHFTPLFLFIISVSAWERHFFQFCAPRFLQYGNAQATRRINAALSHDHERAGKSKRERERERDQRSINTGICHVHTEHGHWAEKSCQQNHSLVFLSTSFKQLSQSSMYVALGSAWDA